MNSPPRTTVLASLFFVPTTLNIKMLKVYFFIENGSGDQEVHATEMYQAPCIGQSFHRPEADYDGKLYEITQVTYELGTNVVHVFARDSGL